MAKESFINDFIKKTGSYDETLTLVWQNLWPRNW